MKLFVVDKDKGGGCPRHSLIAEAHVAGAGHIGWLRCTLRGTGERRLRTRAGESGELAVSAFVLARVGARRRADDTPEMPVQLALVVQPDARRDFARLHARCE